MWLWWTGRRFYRACIRTMRREAGGVNDTRTRLSFFPDPARATRFSAPPPQDIQLRTSPATHPTPRSSTPSLMLMTMKVMMTPAQ